MQKQKDLKSKLIEIERLHDAMFHRFPHVVIGVVDRDLSFSMIDGRGFHEINSQNKSTQKIELPSFYSEAIPKIKKAFDGESINYEGKSNGKFFKITAIPIGESSTEIENVLCLLEDVTDQRRMEEELLKSLDKEKELGELKSRFVTMASHEFRTPLTTILASSFLLENYKGVDFDKEKLINLNRIKRAVNNLTTILNEFLSLQKLEENKVKLVFTEINVPEYIQDDLISEMDVLKKQGQVIKYEHAGDAMTHLDHHIFWSILTNLISNALKYSRVNDVIHVSSAVKDNSVKLIVEDRGIGIPSSEHQFIFGRFYRATNALNIEGTGLGLHIVQKYVHLLNGSIMFESELERGTRFTVVIPEAKAPAAKLSDHHLIELNSNTRNYGK